MRTREDLYWKLKEARFNIDRLRIKMIIPHVKVKSYYGGVYAWDYEIVMTKKQERKLLKRGYVPRPGCWAACGYGWVERKEEGDKVRYRLYECYCHPGQYAIFF